MKRPIVIKHQFVEFIPDVIEDHVVYVSLRFGTAVHLCCCGCQNKVVTPLRPTDWQITFDGKTISLYPSIGNWSFPCRSHYWIKNNRIQWAASWSNQRVEAGRKADQLEKDTYFRSETGDSTVASPSNKQKPQQLGFWKKLRNWLFSI